MNYIVLSFLPQSSQFNKLEKADILEMTVKHLRTLQTQQQTQQQQLTQASDPNSNTKYTAGFMECANEVMRFLKQSSGFSDEIKTRVVGHLANCLHQSQAQSYPRAPAGATIVNQSAPAPRLNPAPAQPTTAQLSNGQIIQIVNTPFQQQSTPVTVQQSAAPPAVLVATSLPTVSQAAPHNSQTSMLSSAASVQPQRTLAQEPVHHEPVNSYSRYCQPLHIQIPTTESPVLVKQIPQAAIPVVRSEERVPVTHHSRAPLSPRSNTSMSVSSSSPSPIEKDISPAPRSSAFKHLDFYANDNYSDYHARSRTFSSASSNESEMMSPLNLSQSPPYDNHKEYSHPIVKPVKIESYQAEKSYNPRDLESSHSFTSVIVNHKKALDIPSAKYMRMMEEERQCVRSQGTPSPASSMGETAVWRPW